MTKRIVLIQPDGSEQVLPKMPTYKEMRAIFNGGWVEHIQVLDRIEEQGTRKHYVMTSMYVDEEGLLKKLPRNEKATILYQRLVRLQNPYSKTPFRDHEEAIVKQYGESGFTYIDATPEHAKAMGFADDPWISGAALWFDGWTVSEVDSEMNRVAEQERNHGA